MAINVLFIRLIDGHAFAAHVSLINLGLVTTALTKHPSSAHFPRFDPSHAKGQLGALTGNQPANFNPLSFPRIGWEWEWGIGGLDWIGNEF